MNAARNAKIVVAQVNDQMPRTFGDCFIPVNEIDIVVGSLPAVVRIEAGGNHQTHHDIGKNVAGLIEDGATLQLGIGAIPDACCSNSGSPGSGVHTEMLSDLAIPLIESGVINGSRKTIHPRKIVLGFVLDRKTLRLRGQ